MRKALLIGKFDDATKEIGNVVSKQYQVIPCSEDEDIITGMLQSEKPDIVVVSLSGSAVAARERFKFLMPSGLPILGIGSSADEAELFISGILSEPNTRFLSKPAKPEDIMSRIHELLGDYDGKSGAADTKGATLLLVDDSPVFLRTLEGMLSKKYKIVFATSGAQALAAVGKNKPDLILLDYEMPVCDGKQTLEMIRSEEDMKDIPVVFLTGISDAKHVSSVIDLHPQGYLLKPCAEETLLAMVEKVLKNK